VIQIWIEVIDASALRRIAVHWNSHSDRMKNMPAVSLYWTVICWSGCLLKKSLYF